MSKCMRYEWQQRTFDLLPGESFHSLYSRMREWLEEIAINRWQQAWADVTLDQIYCVARRQLIGTSASTPSEPPADTPTK